MPERRKIQSGRKKKKSIQEDTEQHLRQQESGIFDPSSPIILRTEANYNQGLSAALPSKTDKSIQPVHFISCTKTETEKRYSQTEKDPLAIKWVKKTTVSLPAWSTEIPYCHSAQTTITLIQ